MTSILIGAIIAIVFIVVFSGSYWWWLQRRSANNDTITLINNPTHFKGDYSSRVMLDKPLLNPGAGHSIEINMEMYVSNHNSSSTDWGSSSYSNKKPIINISDNIILMYSPIKGRLYLFVKYINEQHESIMTQLNLGVIPLQKWSTHIIQITDTHIIYKRDGIVQFSKMINFVPILKGMRVLLGMPGNNFMGKIRKLTLK